MYSRLSSSHLIFHTIDWPTIRLFSMFDEEVGEKIEERKVEETLKQKKQKEQKQQKQQKQHWRFS